MTLSRKNVSAQVLCAFDSCPDIEGIHEALSETPNRIRGLGVPLGNDRAEMEAATHAQLAAGFSGIRLSDCDVVERPWLLDITGRANKIAIVCGRPSTPTTASVLLRHLERFPEAIVIGGHFAGGGDPDVLKGGPVGELFSHPRFFVLFSRHGGYSTAMIEPWARAVVEKTGWSRLMWGSEAPVLFWRNETMVDALTWVDGLSPSPEERAAFFGGNVQKLYFDAPLEIDALQMPFPARERARDFPATFWMHGLPIEQALAGRLVAAWRASGTTGALGNYLEQLLEKTLPPLP